MQKSIVERTIKLKKKKKMRERERKALNKRAAAEREANEKNH